MRHFLHLAYQGTRYHGWQRQSRHISVQQVIEEALEKMLKKEIRIMGCGRTDAGVHASQYYAHAYLPEQWDFDPVERLNRILPNDIAIKEIFPVGSRRHAQKSVVSRTYEYHWHLTKDPFSHHTSTYFPDGPLDIESMQALIPAIREARDFRFFCKQAHLYKTTHCEIMESSLQFEETNQQLCFRITANRFLRSMIRLLVQRMIKVGQGQLPPEAFSSYLKLKEKPRFFYQAPPQGLYLTAVTY